MHTYLNYNGTSVLLFFQVVDSGERSLHRSQSFHGRSNETFKERNPLAGILTTAYGVRIT